MRFPLYPVVDQTLVDVNLMFGVDIVHRWVPTKADREKAARYDVKAALEEALQQRKEAGLENDIWRL